MKLRYPLFMVSLALILFLSDFLSTKSPLWRWTLLALACGLVNYLFEKFKIAEKTIPAYLGVIIIICPFVALSFT
ncbi:hypothetical protein [Paenibacillus elgii]|uniref:hypothetical protein n=1 Tax=Paenibacillus elgii TaxID=189691 RepID=UPI00203B1C61|nr:hypothetical protein [Paenibacillus elgii]MCM3273644.1 hypothetical protein [Paenibacillus elgii]